MIECHRLKYGALALTAGLGLMLGLEGCASSRSQETQAASHLDYSFSLQTADAVLQEGRFAEALQLYQEVLVVNPKAVPAQYGVAESLLALGRASEGAPIFVTLASNPEYRARALQGQGLALLCQNRDQVAAERLSEATAADPTLWRAYNGLGLVADNKRDHEAAAHMYQRALEIQPQSVVILNNFGYSRLLAGNTDEAIRYLRKALALDPSSETIQNNLRIALAAAGNYKEALHSPAQDRRAVILNNVGYVAMKKGDIRAAEGFLARAMEASPSFNSVAAQNLEQLKVLKTSTP
jgi:Flp pilus assembly protein TadD